MTFRLNILINGSLFLHLIEVGKLPQDIESFSKNSYRELKLLSQTFNF